jgi:TubC N-terminal docking domain
MDVGEVLMEIGRRGVSLRAGRTEDRLHYRPAGGLTPELVADLKEHKAEIIEIMREEEEDRRLKATGIVQSERQAFEMAQKRFGGLNRAGEC